MREKIGKTFESILKENRCNKSVSTITNPRSKINDTQNQQPSGSKVNKFNGVHASSNVNLDSDEDEDPLRASVVNEWRNPAILYQNRLNLDETMVLEEDSEEEDFHNTILFRFCNAFSLTTA